MQLRLKSPQQAVIQQLAQASHQITEMNIGADMLQLFSEKWHLYGTSIDEKLTKQSELDAKLFALASKVGVELAKILEVSVHLSGSVQQGTANAQDYDFDYVANKSVTATQLDEEAAKLRRHTGARNVYPMKAKRVVRIEHVTFNGQYIQHLDVTFSDTSTSSAFGNYVYGQSPRTRLLMTDVKNIFKRLQLVDTYKNYISSCGIVVAVLSFYADILKGKQYGDYDELFNSFCHYFGTFDFARCAMHAEHGTVEKPVDTEFRAAVIMEHLSGTNVAERLQHAQLEVVQTYFKIFAQIPHFDFMISN